jgi:hypothetical protein
MATSNSVNTLGDLTASADLRTSQFLAVRITGSRTVGLISASTQVPIGILQNKPNTGEAAEVAISGKVKAIAGAAITAGAEVMVNASGQVITAATTGNRAFGVAVSTAAGANELVEILLPAAPRVMP